jgi:ATP-binding protein involved in chromosome partitioning
VIGERLAAVGRIVAVTGGKGGVGKSVVASTLALVLAEAGSRTGLLDLDLTGPCAHIILGIPLRLPDERFGIEPLEVHGIRFLSLACFGGERPAPLRGPEATEALIELLAITRWGGLDVLVIDMPPGLGDAALDALRWLPRAEYLVVANSSPVVIETVRRTLELLGRQGRPVLGLLENMQRDPPGSAVRALARSTGTRWLGSVPYDAGLDSALGDASRLGETAVAAALRTIARTLPGI